MYTAQQGSIPVIVYLTVYPTHGEPSAPMLAADMAPPYTRSLLYILTYTHTHYRLAQSCRQGIVMSG